MQSDASAYAMSKVFFLSKVSFKFFLCAAFICSGAYADIVTTEEKEIQGVIVQTTDEFIRIMTPAGEKTVPVEEVLEVERLPRADALERLAEIHQELGDPVKAYNLYQRGLRRDASREDSVKALEQLEQRVRQASQEEWLSSFGRFDKKPLAEEPDEQFLRENAEMTDALLRNKGLVLDDRAGFIIISFLSETSPLADKGIRANDRIAEIDGTIADYFGLFDVIALLLASEGEKEVVFERTIRMWHSVLPDSPQPDAFRDITGFTVESGDAGCLVKDVEDATTVALWGLKPGDVIESINGQRLQPPCQDQIKEAFLSRTSLSHIEMVIRRKIRI